MNKLFSLLSFCLLSAVYPEEKPNIIFIEVDDLPAHYIATMGADFAETPTLDRLASEGVFFNNAVSQGLTVPSKKFIDSRSIPSQYWYVSERPLLK